MYLYLYLCLMVFLCFRYFFPTYENDGLLCVLVDSEEEEEGAGPAEGAGTAEGVEQRDVPVIAEDLSDLKALRDSSVLNQLLRNPQPPLPRTRWS